MKRYFLLLELLIALSICSLVIPVLLYPSLNYLKIHKNTYQSIEEEILTEELFSDIKEEFSKNPDILKRLQKKEPAFISSEKESLISLEIEKSNTQAKTFLVKCHIAFPSKNAFSRWFVVHEKTH